MLTWNNNWKINLNNTKWILTLLIVLYHINIFLYEQPDQLFIYIKNLGDCAVPALSYKITSDYGIPHGHAVAITIAKLFKLNTEKGQFNELKELISHNSIEYFSSLFKEIELEYNFVKLGITDIQSIANNINSERLNNNPIELSFEDLIKLLTNEN